MARQLLQDYTQNKVFLIEVTENIEEWNATPKKKGIMQAEVKNKKKRSKSNL